MSQIAESAINDETDDAEKVADNGCDSASSSNTLQELDPRVLKMFQEIVRNDNVFYKSQQRGEADLTTDNKMSVLSEIFQWKPVVFLERYHHLIGFEFVDLFDGGDERVSIYLCAIRLRNNSSSTRKSAANIRNQRYAELLRLRAEGKYFSNEKMRERDPQLFDLMIGKYMNDDEKFHLRPTVYINMPNGGTASDFTTLLGQLEETQRISDRRRRFLDEMESPSCSNVDPDGRFMNHVNFHTAERDNDEEFQMEFDSSDDEGREAEENRLRVCRNNRKNFVNGDPPIAKFAEAHKMSDVHDTSSTALPPEAGLRAMTVSSPLKNDIKNTAAESPCWSSGDEDEHVITGISREQLYDEFVSIMEERFLSGKDADHFDYSLVDGGRTSNKELDRMREQDAEDAFFGE